MEFGVSLTELQSMFPFERELYCHLIARRTEEKKKRQEGA